MSYNLRGHVSLSIVLLLAFFIQNNDIMSVFAIKTKNIGHNFRILLLDYSLLMMVVRRFG